MPCAMPSSDCLTVSRAPLRWSGSSTRCEQGRVAVVDDGPGRGEGGWDQLLGHLGRHIDLEWNR